LHPKAAKFLRKLDKQVRLGVRKKVAQLKARPELGKRLRYTNFWSLRVGDYRVIYEVWWDEKKVVVLFIGHRKRVYENFSKLF
jgi:mRNA interferase RelE/StbE